MASLKNNVVYSSILTISGYLFPILTYPYVTRVLGVDKIGICNYVGSIISYGLLFAMMGLGSIAIREIAQVKDDKQKLSQTFSSLLLLHLITSLFVFIVILIMTFNVPSFHNYQKLLIIGSSQILLNAFLIEWLFKGLENFKYITIRSLIVRVIYVFAIFILVRSEDDYILYFSINIVTVAINAFVNIAYSRHFLFFTIKNIDIKPYIRPFFVLGTYQLLTSMYTSFNVTYLGFISGTTEVGYYTTATKLYTLILSIYTAFTGVMMPRLSALIAEGNKDEFMRLIDKSMSLLFAFIIPVVAYVLVFAPNIIRLIAGEGYEGATLPLRIIAPMLVIIGYEQIIIIQILMPLKKDKAILYNSIFGALVGLLLNIILIPTFKSCGSAIVWISSELVVMISAQYFVYKYISVKFPLKDMFNRLLLLVPAFVLCLVIKQCVSQFLLSLIAGSVVILIHFVICELYIYKNDIIVQSFNKIIKR